MTGPWFCSENAGCVQRATGFQLPHLRLLQLWKSMVGYVIRCIKLNILQEELKNRAVLELMAARGSHHIDSASGESLLGRGLCSCQDRVPKLQHYQGLDLGIGPWDIVFKSVK